MIDKDKLKEVLTDVQIVILKRIMLLTEASKLIEGITIARLNDESDEWIMALIRNNLAYRKTFADMDNNLDEDERKVWEKLLHIDQTNEKG